MSDTFAGEFLGYDFIFWMGVVEDRDDPIKLGRLRVRIFTWHSEDISKVPKSALPWAQVIQPTTSSSNGDLGHSPTNIVEGTWVVGFFLDGKRGQQPIIMGTLPGIPTSGSDPSKGFNDPNAIYPKLVNQPDVNRLARNDADFPHPVPLLKELDRTRGVSTSIGETWDEPESTYATTYPKNHVYESESGHIKEYDDTKDAERIHEYHKSGTFYEIDKDGNKVTRVVKDNYEVIAGSNFVNIKGVCNVTIDSNCNLYVKGNVDILADGTFYCESKGNMTFVAPRIDLNP